MSFVFVNKLFYRFLIPFSCLSLLHSTITARSSDDSQNDGSGDYFRRDGYPKGPWLKPTKGLIWPLPKSQVVGENMFIIKPDYFQFKLDERASKKEIITDSIERFRQRAFPFHQANSENNSSQSEFDELSHFITPVTIENGYQILKGVSVELLEEESNVDDPPLNEQFTAADQKLWPDPHMNEAYEIKIGPDESYIRSSSVWGLLRGLESLTHLVHHESQNSQYEINEIFVQDEPRFEHRGLMIDTARHFLTPQVIIKILDLMEMNKMNVLHWHITDNEAFPFYVKSFPKLSEEGAFDGDHVYDSKSVEAVLEEARKRGIRVIPEFDVPGHTKSWESGHSGLLSSCGSEAKFGPLDPTKESLYKFLEKLYEEIRNVFPEEHVFMGGDEVQHDCWSLDTELVSRMQDLNIDNFHELERYFIDRLTEIVLKPTSINQQNGQIKNKSSTSRFTSGLNQILSNVLPSNYFSLSKDVKNDGNGKAIVWEEAFHPDMNKNIIVSVWRDWSGTYWTDTIRRIVASNHEVILSAPWYLNGIKYGSDWVKMYKVDPLNFSDSHKYKHLVIGGEACIWGEFVNSMNVISRTFPRASAIAERLWSERREASPLSSDDEMVGRRMLEMQCRMLSRGYPVQEVVGAGFCPGTPF